MGQRKTPQTKAKTKKQNGHWARPRHIGHDSTLDRDRAIPNECTVNTCLTFGGLIGTGRRFAVDCDKMNESTTHGHASAPTPSSGPGVCTATGTPSDGACSHSRFRSGAGRSTPKKKVMSTGAQLMIEQRGGGPPTVRSTTDADPHCHTERRTHAPTSIGMTV